MSGGYTFSKSAWLKFVEMVKWYERVKHQIKPQHRRRQIISGGGGALPAVIVTVVRGIKYDDPDRAYPAGCAWTGCTASDPWPLVDQDAYWVRKQSDATAVYSTATEYNENNYCLFTVLAATTCASVFGKFGYTYSLKYKCTNTEGTTGTFKDTDWELVNDVSEGQWEIDRPKDWDASHGRGSGQFDDMRNYTPWFSLGAESPVITIDYGTASVPDERTLFDDTFNWLGITGERSAAWNEDDNRLMMVYR